MRPRVRVRVFHAPSVAISLQDLKCSDCSVTRRNVWRLHSEGRSPLRGSEGLRVTESDWKATLRYDHVMPNWGKKEGGGGGVWWVQANDSVINFKGTKGTFKRKASQNQF